MPQFCLPAGCIDAIRVSRVDQCSDLPVPGTTSGYIFNCFRNVELTKNIEEGAETVLRNGCGKKCFQTKQCDELTNVTVAFELLNPDYELTNLLTGQPLINDGVENIGWYQNDGLNCSPWVCVELFEQVPSEACSPEHKYRRIVLPKVRFQTPGDTREEPFRIVPFTGLSAAASVSTWATGPFDDSPFDFSAMPDDASTHIMEFFDSSITETLEGTCGFITVPTPPPNFLVVYDPDTDTLTITSNQNVFGPLSTIFFTGTNSSGGPLTAPDFNIVNPNTVTIPNASTLFVAPNTITELEFYNSTPSLIGVWNGSVLIPGGGTGTAEITLAVSDYTTTIDGAFGQVLDCAGLPDAAAVPVLLVGGNDLSDGGLEGVRLNTTTGVLDIMRADDPTSWYIYTPNAVIIGDAALTERVVTSVQALDISGTPFGSVVAAETEWYDVDVAGVENTDTLRIEYGASPAYELPSYVTVAQVCPGPATLSITYYDPLGGDADLNPPGATFVQWDSDGIVVTDPDLVAFVTEVITITATDSVLNVPHGVYLKVDDPIPPL